MTSFIRDTIQGAQFHITIVKTTDSSERGMNPVTMTIISPRKEYWPSRGSNQRPPVLKSATLPTFFPTSPLIISVVRKKRTTSMQSKSIGLISLMLLFIIRYTSIAEPHSSVGSVADLRTGGRWFDPRLGQYSFRGLMIVIVTGFIPLSLLSVVLTMVMLESNQWLGKNIVRSAG